MTTIADITAFLQQIIPLDLAAEWDNVGLLLGDESATTHRVMTCLTVTPESAAEAIEARAEFIITHHPILFRGTKRLSTATPEGRMVWDLARAGISVYSPHTAFDNARGGINDLLANLLGLSQLRPLRVGDGPRHCKVIVFVPEADLAKVSDAMFAAGAGNIGQYSRCSFRLLGTGTFFGSEAAKPTVGVKGRSEEVNEWRLEAICPENAVDDIVSAIRQAHSYEEPAYDIYPLQPVRAKVGQGRCGALSQPTTLGTLAEIVKEGLRAGWVQTVGDVTRSVQRIALACGAAGEFLTDAIREKADAFLTGEVRFHDALAAQSEGIALLLPGHHASERLGLESLAQRLAAQFPQLDVWASRRERDPFSMA